MSGYANGFYDSTGSAQQQHAQTQQGYSLAQHPTHAQTSWNQFSSMPSQSLHLSQLPSTQTHHSYTSGTASHNTGSLYGSSGFNQAHHSLNPYALPSVSGGGTLTPNQTGNAASMGYHSPGAAGMLPASASTTSLSANNSYANSPMQHSGSYYGTLGQQTPNGMGSGSGTNSPAYSSAPSYSTQLPMAGRHRVTTTLWEDEHTLCYQVDARGVCVARRADNDMINGTKLLNVCGMSRGKRDGILKNEKERIVVKVGAMHLKGVWISFVRGKQLAEQNNISDALYPLFESNIQSFLYHPDNYPRTAAVMAAAQERQSRVSSNASSVGGLRAPSSVAPPLMRSHTSPSGPLGLPGRGEEENTSSYGYSGHGSAPVTASQSPANPYSASTSPLHLVRPPAADRRHSMPMQQGADPNVYGSQPSAVRKASALKRTLDEQGYEQQSTLNGMYLPHQQQTGRQSSGGSYASDGTGDGSGTAHGGAEFKRSKSNLGEDSHSHAVYSSADYAGGLNPTMHSVSNGSDLRRPIDLALGQHSRSPSSGQTWTPLGTPSLTTSSHGSEDTSDLSVGRGGYAQYGVYSQHGGTQPHPLDKVAISNSMAYGQHSTHH